MTCERCGGTGFEIMTRDGREYAQRCPCRAAHGGREDDVLTACRIPPRYEHCTLAHFEMHSASQQAAHKKCERYCSGYPYVGATDEGLGLLFTGSSGVGKTHLAVAVLLELVTAKRARGQFWDFHSLIREIRNSYDPEIRTTELQVLQPVVDTDILVLDDLGAWKMTDWMVDTLFYILNSRYLARRSTVITTNFQDVAPEVARKDGSTRAKEYLVERIGVPLRSRLLEMCLLIDIAADDHRQSIQVSNNETVVGPAIKVSGRQ